MTTMASNYDMNRLVTGGIVATAALGAGIAAVVVSPKAGPGKWPAFSFITILYGVMMFASSYVEEEHHFWYWITSAWLLSLGFKRYRATLDPSPRMKTNARMEPPLGFPTRVTVYSPRQRRWRPSRCFG